MGISNLFLRYFVGLSVISNNHVKKHLYSLAIFQKYSKQILDFLDAIPSLEMPYTQVTHLLSYLLTHRVEITFYVRTPGLSDKSKLSIKTL